jgi:hypothetical protein
VPDFPVLAPVLVARPPEEAPPPYGDWLTPRPAVEDEEAVPDTPSGPSPPSVSFSQNLMTQSL